MLEFTLENLSVADAERLRAAYEPLTQSIRALIDATIRSKVDVDVVAAAKAEIDSATARLRNKQVDSAVGVRHVVDGEHIHWGNAAVGVRNAIAPPLVVKKDSAGRAWADLHLGAAYGGPPGLVHGGVASLVLDHMLGDAASEPDDPRMTGTITLQAYSPLACTSFADMNSGLVDSAAACSRVTM